MTDAILFLGLAWWLGGTFFGTRHRVRHGAGGALAAGAPRGALFGVGGGSLLAMLWLARTASERIAASDASFGPFVFGAVTCALLAGCALGAATA